jgi:hypothetical protein
MSVHELHEFSRIIKKIIRVIRGQKNEIKDTAMKKIILKTTAILLMIAGIVSCGKDDEPVALAGTNWQFTGIMDTETGELMELEPPIDCHHCYTLNFHTDITAVGRSKYENIILLHLSPKLIIIPITMVDYDRIDDAQLFYNAMEILTSYTVIKDELKLYYNGKKNYLLFKRFEYVYY